MALKGARMGFSCDCEIEIRGGAREDRLKAAGILLAAECADEDSARRDEGDEAGSTRFESADGVPEEELSALADQFPELAFTLLYFSLDGEFYGYAAAGPGERRAAESEDLTDEGREAVGLRHDGDGLAFVRARYSLPRAAK